MEDSKYLITNNKIVVPKFNIKSKPTPVIFNSDTPPVKKIKLQQNENKKVNFNVVPKQSLQEQRRALPIYAVRNRLLDELKRNQTLIIIGETGSGKSTQIPQFIHSARLQDEGKIGVTQPRRVAAITIAARVAQEMGTELGEVVGFSVRFEDVTSRRTRIKYLTDGMLLREAMANSLLMNYNVLILDEAHERTIHTDVLFGIVKHAQKLRSERNLAPLKILIMSATMDVDHFSKYFNNCKTVYIEGRTHPIDIFHTTVPQDDYQFSCLVTLFKIHREAPPNHDVLIFLTGQEEIEAMVSMIYNISRDPELSKCPNIKVFPLYASLSSEHQLDVFKPTPMNVRKVILSTNVAETSLTISGIKYVIDSGMVKARIYRASTGLDSLKIQKISQAQAWQRTGRAGRESKGFCYRMFTKKEYQKMDKVTLPEILRCNLSTVCLQLLALGIHPGRFDFMDRPPEDAIERAFYHLQLLGAVESDSLKNFSCNVKDQMIQSCKLEPDFSSGSELNFRHSLGVKRHLKASLESKMGSDSSLKSKMCSDSSFEHKKEARSFSESQINLDSSSESKMHSKSPSGVKRHLKAALESKMCSDSSLKPRKHVKSSFETEIHLDSSSKFFSGAKQHLKASLESKMSSESSLEANKHIRFPSESEEDSDSSPESKLHSKFPSGDKRHLKDFLEPKMCSDSSLDPKMLAKFSLESELPSKQTDSLLKLPQGAKFKEGSSKSPKLYSASSKNSPGSKLPLEPSCESTSSFSTSEGTVKNFLPKQPPKLHSKFSADSEQSLKQKLPPGTELIKEGSPKFSKIHSASSKNSPDSSSGFGASEGSQKNSPSSKQPLKLHSKIFSDSELLLKQKLPPGTELFKEGSPKFSKIHSASSKNFSDSSSGFGSESFPKNSPGSKQPLKLHSKIFSDSELSLKQKLPPGTELFKEGSPKFSKIHSISSKNSLDSSLGFGASEGPKKNSPDSKFPQKTACPFNWSSAPKLTPLGRKMSQFPLDPRFSKILLSAKDYGCLEEVLTIISVLSSESVLVNPSSKREQAIAARQKFASPYGDHITLLNIYRAFNNAAQKKHWCFENFLSFRNLSYAKEVRGQLADICEKCDLPLSSCGGNMDQIRKCLITGLFMNTAELYRNNVNSMHFVTLDSNQVVSIHPSSVLHGMKPHCIIFTEVVQTTNNYLRFVSTVEPQWLNDIVPEYMQNHRLSTALRGN